MCSRSLSEKDSSGNVQFVGRSRRKGEVGLARLGRLAERMKDGKSLDSMFEKGRRSSDEEEVDEEVDDRGDRRKDK